MRSGEKPTELITCSQGNVKAMTSLKNSMNFLAMMKEKKLVLLEGDLELQNS